MLMIMSGIRKESGFGSIICHASITGIKGSLYGAAAIGGAGGMRRIRHMTLPGIGSAIGLMQTCPRAAC